MSPHSNRLSQTWTDLLMSLRSRTVITPSLFFAYLSFILASLILLYSVSPIYGQKQLLNLIPALASLIIIAQIPLVVVWRTIPFVYLMNVCLLAFVLASGEVGKGAQRWIEVGPINLQPSEFMKIILPATIAWWLEKTQDSDTQIIPSIGLVGLILIPLGLVIMQPDLGTSIMIAINASAIIILIGVSWKIISGIVALGLLSLPMLWINMHAYQKQRIYTFLDPYQDPLGNGYHTIQSQTAIGSGGLIGKGWQEGSQSQLGFVPEQHTDFIISLLAEEFGLIGIVLILCLYAFVLLKGLHIAHQSVSLFNRILAATLSLNFFLNALVNIAMVSGLLPVVGLPIPLISYGGSSLLMNSIAFGLLMAVDAHNRQANQHLALR